MTRLYRRTCGYLPLAAIAGVAYLIAVYQP